MRLLLVFILLTTAIHASGQGVIGKTATAVGGGHRIDSQTAPFAKWSVMPKALYDSCLLWDAFSYSDNSDADFYDLSTGANDGVQTNVASQPAHNTSSGGFYVFDDVDDYIDHGDVAAVDAATALTVSMWVYHDTVTGDDGLASKWATDGFIMWRDDVTSISGRTDTYTFFVADSADTSTARIEGATAASPATTWTHVVATFVAASATGLRLYVDGTEDANSPVDVSAIAAIDAGAASLVFGNRSDIGLAFDGRIDDVRVFDRALTGTEATALWNDTKSTYGL